MSDAPNYRMERITRLLHELEYEIVRGMMEREIDESLSFLFFVPVSSQIENGVVKCEFRTRPMPHYMADVNDFKPTLRVIKP